MNKVALLRGESNVSPVGAQDGASHFQSVEEQH